MRKHRHHSDDEAEVDMTPMLDIVFIMLIFFIVTTSFVKEDGIELNRPSKNQTNEPQKSKGPILFKLADNGEITIKGRIIDVGGVRANVESAKAKRPNAPVIVQAAEGSDSGIMVQIVDQAKQAGVDKVIVAKEAK